MDFVKSVLLFLSFAAFLVWVGVVWQAEGEDKLDVACHPVDIGTNTVIDVTTALIGFTPNWTLSARRYLQGGCYYFFSIMLGPKTSNQIGGGVRN